MNRTLSVALLVGGLVAIAAPAAAFDFFPGDVHRDIEQSAEIDHRTDLDQDDVLLAIVLANSGVDVDLADVLEVHSETEIETDVRQHVDLDGDDTLLAIALGASGGLGGHGIFGISGLSDVTGFSDLGAFGSDLVLADVDVSTSDRMEVDRRVDLDHDDVLLGIALSNSIGGTMNFEDLADIHQDVERELEMDSDVDLDEDDVLFGIALAS